MERVERRRAEGRGKAEGKRGEERRKESRRFSYFAQADKLARGSA